MGNILHPDFQDFIRAFNYYDVDYILIGGYAVILYGHSRTTGDMDIWVKQTSKNYKKIVQAFEKFGMPVYDMTENNFLNSEKFDVFTFGVPPVCIDLMTQTKGLTFDVAFEKSTFQKVDDLSLRVIAITDLIKQKQIVDRPKDQDDVDHLKTIEEE